MRRFRVTVNGRVYDVEVVEVGAEEREPSRAVERVVEPAPRTAPARMKLPEKPAQPSAGPAAPARVPKEGEVVASPLPGTIVDIKVAAGQAVKRGQVLLIIEAMKMENEVVAPRDGTVAEVAVAKGASVNSGDALVVLD